MDAPATVDTPTGDPAGPGHGERPRRVGPGATVGLYVAAVLIFLVGSVGLARAFGGPHTIERVVVIPAGTASRVAAGEPVDIIPTDLTFNLDDTLVVVNEDSTGHTIGPYTVGPGERLETRLSKAATFSGFCSLHPSGNVDIKIATT